MEKNQENDRIYWTYELTNNIIDGKENLRYTTYGVRALDSLGNPQAVYADVSTDRQSVEALVGKCNEGGLHLLHLEDVLLDLIE
jgi:hypothetical protein